jgi:hypothetical protein
MDIKNYLPLGSIVKLKGGARKLVIIGINQKGSNNETYDYSAVLYPYGYINSEELFLFNNSNIDEIIYKGYSDKELEDYYDDLVWAINKEKEEKNNG